MLQAQGHDVFTPTLTGLADKSHLLTRETDLDTHIMDIVNLLVWEDLSDVILCGHSYGGLVVADVANRVPDRVSALVYLDAFVPKDGETLHDALPIEVRTQHIEGAKQFGDGWRVPPVPAEAFNVNEADRAWVDRQCTPQPLATLTQPVRLTDPAGSIDNISYILATGWAPSPFGQILESAKQASWKTTEIDCGHDVMLDRPEELVQLLQSLPAL